MSAKEKYKNSVLLEIFGMRNSLVYFGCSRSHAKDLIDEGVKLVHLCYIVDEMDIHHKYKVAAKLAKDIKQYITTLEKYNQIMMMERFLSVVKQPTIREYMIEVLDQE